eukprot:4335442-Pyramimonas_sp.AAC.1
MSLRLVRGNHLRICCSDPARPPLPITAPRRGGHQTARWMSGRAPGRPSAWLPISGGRDASP